MSFYYRIITARARESNGKEKKMVKNLAYIETVHQFLYRENRQTVFSLVY